MADSAGNWISDEHPLVLAFRHLRELRRYAVDHPGDAAGRFVAYCAANLMRSSSQLLQDLFVLFCLQNKQGGFFVEFGAADGVNLSNRYCLSAPFNGREYSLSLRDAAMQR